MDDPVGVVFAPVLGLPSWSVRRGHGSFVTLEFGDPFVEIGRVRPRKADLPGLPETIPRRFTKCRGSWHLWIYCCVWTLWWRDSELAHCESDDVTMARALAVLDGQALTSVTVDPTDGSTRFGFDLDCVLYTRPDVAAYGPLTEQWLLHRPDDGFLAVRDDGCFTTDSARRDEQTWRPLPSHGNPGVDS